MNWKDKYNKELAGKTFINLANPEYYELIFLKSLNEDYGVIKISTRLEYSILNFYYTEIFKNINSKKWIVLEKKHLLIERKKWY